MANTFLMRFVALLLCLSLTSCDASPQLSGDPEGVDRNARPQVIIKRKAVLYEDKELTIGATRTAELNAYFGHEMEDYTEPDNDWGLSQFANNLFENSGVLFRNGALFSHGPHDPKSKESFLFRIQIWVRQEIDYSRDLPCTAEEEDEHRVDTARLIKLAEETERDEGWSRRSQIQALREKPCIAPGWRPNTPFKGYLEVDGIPIGPRMSFSEIAARRKQLKLSPLEKDPLDPGGRIYRAMAPDGSWDWDQVWYFEWTDSKNPDDRLLQNISVE